MLFSVAKCNYFTFFVFDTITVSNITMNSEYPTCTKLISILSESVNILARTLEMSESNLMGEMYFL